MRAPVTSRHCGWSRAPARRWPAVGCTTSWPAASRATPSTRRGWCRTSRRCSTTTRCCCRVYTHLWRATGSLLARRVALETADWMLRDLRTPEGGFASALDADTDGVEGLTYAWTPDQLVEVLGADDGAWAAELLRVTPAGTFEHGASTLQLPVDPDDAARWELVRGRLLSARGARPQPARDDKVVAAWNGLAVAALAEAGAVLDRPDLVEAAVAAADLLLRLHVVDGRLRRVSRDGVGRRTCGRARGPRRRRRGTARAARRHRGPALAARRRIAARRGARALRRRRGWVLRHRRRPGRPRAGGDAPTAGPDRRRDAERAGPRRAGPC